MIKHIDFKMGSQDTAFWICENTLPSEILTWLPLIFPMTKYYSLNWIIVTISVLRDLFLPPSSFLLSNRMSEEHSPTQQYINTSLLMILVLLSHKCHLLQLLFLAIIRSQMQKLPVNLFGRCHFVNLRKKPSSYLTLPDTIPHHYVREN